MTASEEELAFASLCVKCPSKTEGLITRPSEFGEVAIVIDQPQMDAIKGDDFFGGSRSGANAILRATLEAAGCDIENMLAPGDRSLFVCSAINCHCSKDKKAMQKNAVLSCRDRLLAELKRAGAEKVLCIGAFGYTALMGLDKLAAPTKVRGRWRRTHGMDILATIPPGFMFGAPANREYFRDFSYDIEKFFTQEGKGSDPDVEVWRPDTIKEAEEAFAFIADHDFVACDIETTGLSPISDDILAVGYGVLDGADGVTVVLDEVLLSKKTTWRLMAKQLNNDQETVFHNGKFDLQFMKQGFLDRKLTYVPNGIHDTMLLNYALDERPMSKFKSHSLKTLARTRFDAPDYDIDIGKWVKEWQDANEYDRKGMREAMHVYLGLDAYYTARLFKTLWNDCMNETDGEDLLDLYEDLLIPASLALSEIEHRGIAIDVEHFENQAKDLDKLVKPLIARLQRKTGIKDFNPGSPKQVQEYIYEDLGLPFGIRTDKDGKVYHSARRGGLQEGPTAAPVLKGLAYKFPEHKKVIDDICEFRNYTKNIGTYVNGILQRVDTDGRMRTSFNIHGTATGRLSSSNPNLQNVPDASHTGIEIRGGFMAEEGSVLIEADYKQLEVRIAAWLSDDDAMREVFEGGRDPHQEIAFSIYKKPKSEITHYMRWLAKNILFGLLYGRGYESVADGPEQEDIAARGGQRWEIKDVKKFYDNLLAEWADFAQWQADQRARGYAEGEIRTPTGRRKRFPYIPKHDAGYVGRASFNNPIQGTASDFTLYALITLHRILPAGAYIVLTVHDSIMIECKKELVKEVSALIEKTMTEDTLIEIDVPLAVDIDVSERWGEKDQLAHVVIDAGDE